MIITFFLIDRKGFHGWRLEAINKILLIIKLIYNISKEDNNTNRIVTLQKNIVYLRLIKI